MRRLAVCAAVLAMGQSGRDAAPTVELLLQRAGAYVAEFERQFSSVVAVEEYVQEAPAPHSGAALRRELKSDFLLVKLPAEDRWLPFRDVFEVDGKAVRDRQERLTKLFLQPPSTAIEQANRIVEESTRYNLGLERTINVPVFAMLVVRPANQSRFRFSRLQADGKAGPGVWSIDFHEEARPTLIQGRVQKDLFSRGRIWIEAASGRVVKTELVVEANALTATVVAQYRLDPEFGLMVPVEMRETYAVRTSMVPTRGTATYSNFRRFTVRTTETLRQ